MEFRNGASILEEEGFQKQGSWIPGTPLKPEHANRMVRVHYIRRGESGGQEITTLNHNVGVGDGAGAREAAVAAQMKVYRRGSSSQRSVGDSLMQGAGDAAAHMKVYSRGSSSQRSAAGLGNNVPLFHLLACANQAPVSTTVPGRRGSAGSFLPIIHAQINNGSSQQLPNSTDLLLQMNHNLIMKLPGWMKGIDSTTGLPASYYPNCRITGDMISNEGPGTPKQNAKDLENPSVITIDLNELSEEAAEAGMQECPITEDVELHTDKVSSPQKIGEDVELPTDQVSPTTTGDDVHLKKTAEGVAPSSTVEPVESHANVLSTPAEEIKDDLDLNKRPRQKVRKRKHRPKVIVEGTAKKTRKKATNQENATNQEKPLQKKRSVRKRGPKPSATQEPVGITREPRRRSCKQYLNFDLEGREEDGSPNEAPVFDLEGQEEDKSPNKASFQMDKQHDSIVGSPSTLSRMWDSGCETAQDVTPSNGSKSNLQLMKGIDESRAWDAFELTSHMKKMLEDYLLLPEEPNPPPITKAMNNNAEASASINGSDASHILMSQCAYSHTEEAKEIEFITQRDMDNNTNIPNKNIPLAGSVQGRKRKERKTEDVFDFHSINFPKIYKKKRTSSCKRFIFQTTDVTAPFTLDGYCNVGDENTKYPVAGEKNQIHQEFMEPQTEAFIRKKLIDDVFKLQIERKIKKKRNVSYRIHKFPKMRIAAGQCKKAIDVFRGPQPCVEALNAENNAKMRTKKRTNMRRKSHHSKSMYNNMQQLQVQLLTDKSSSHFQTTSVMNFPFQALSDLNRAVDYITQKFACLVVSGNKKTDMAGALVPYGGYKTMVPYEGHYIKRQRSRAKVDLDAETNRVWKLLMWKEGSDEANEVDAEKEKWWEEERRVFQGRAESFIAKMHLVQGDRRFSKWKGSVVDSVIGVFLTQNVSDHLSSSAYMALAARFPVQSQNSSKGPDLELTSKSADDENLCTLDSDENIKWNDESLCQSSGTLHEAEAIEKEIPSLNESFGSSLGGSVAAIGEGKRLDTSESGLELCHKLPGNRVGTSVTVAESSNLEDPDFRRGPEDFVSPQVFAVSSQASIDSTIHTADRIISSQESNSEINYPTESPVFSSFTELLQSQIVGSKEHFINEDRGMLLDETFGGMIGQSNGLVLENANSSLKGICCLNGSCSSMYLSNAHCPQAMHYNQELPAVSYSGYQLHSSPGSSGTVEQESVEASGDESRCSLPPNNHEGTGVDYIYSTERRMDFRVKTMAECMVQQNMLSGDQIATVGDPHACKCKDLSHGSSSYERVHQANNPVTCNNLPCEKTQASFGKDTTSTCSESHFGQTNSPQNPRDGDLELEVTGFTGRGNLGEELVQSQNSRTENTDSHSNLPKHLGETIDVSECSSFVDNPPVERTGIKLNKKEADGSKNMSPETTDGTSHVKKERRSTEKKKDFDWDSLRKQVCQDGPKTERSSDRMDSLDWEAVRCADVHEISNTIRERGMNNRLAVRIKDFLNRLVRDHGSIDLEWLRDIPPDKAKDYLLSIWGLGLKSVECVRLLTLHHLAFPVDTNVGRICVRLGWVPIQPLPESLQLHLLELYPMLETIQKYLWPRLCTLDQKTLYELHYQMITFGKVFCTKSKPNCNACPMRAECRHFASAFASARHALPCPEEKSIVSSAVPVIPKAPVTPEVHHGLVIDPLPLPPIEGHPHSAEGSTNRICEPFIEEPPEDECPDALQNETQASDNDIEDTFWQEDPDEIPTIRLNIEEFTINVQNYMQQNNLELQDMSKALVALKPEAASIPMPKLKNVSRLRTEHQVYELPDSHPLLAGLDRREPDDPCSYLLAIWTPGETAMSTQPPEICCNSQESGNLCNRKTCFSCNSMREAQAQTVRGTLLIPCRTAMRGSFPLNGTYFQVNEVFADHDSSLAPINVPRSLIWNLPRRTVYFGTSIPSIFKGLTTEGIQQCFWRGYVCVRGFDQKTRAPRPLIARLHFPASKLVKTKKAAPTNVT